MSRPPAIEKALAGALLGTAVGDSLGLPMEGLSARRQARLFPPPLRQRLVGSRGMISDDTEHTLMLAQSLLAFPADLAAFQRDLARRLRWWLVALPAGVGFATLRAILRLWSGVPPSHSGLVSAGKGPAMRSALLGVYFVDDTLERQLYTQASAEITHRDPRAVIAALAVAETATWMTQESDDVDALWQTLADLSHQDDWPSLVAKMRAAFESGTPTAELAQQVGATKGVSGFAFQSVPVAIYAAVRNRRDFSAALGEAIACGGDTDTVGAITGALVGARVGVDGIPPEWIEQIAENPRSPALLQRVAEKLARQKEAHTPLGPVRYWWPLIPFRNLAFLAVVLAHGFRRIFPPY